MNRQDQYFEYKKKGLSAVYLKLHSVSHKCGISTGAGPGPTIPQQYTGAGWINGSGEGNCPNSPPRGEHPFEIRGGGVG